MPEISAHSQFGMEGRTSVLSLAISAAGLLPSLEQNGSAPQSTQVWKTISLRGTRHLSVLLEEARRAGAQFTCGTTEMLAQSNFQIVNNPRSVDLVVVTPHDLGFQEASTYQAICTRAQELGLELCDPEVGYQLRMQYMNQQLGEWLRIAMTPIATAGRGERIFRVFRDQRAAWLGWLYGHPSSVWDLGFSFVFVRPRQQQLPIAF